jgi:hypothetical protein
MPINIIKRTLKKIFGKNDMTDDLSGSAFGIVSGLLLKKIFIGRSGSNIRKLFGSLLQMGISKLVSQNSEVIKSFIQSVFQYFFHKNKSQ